MSKQVEEEESQQDKEVGSGSEGLEVEPQTDGPLRAALLSHVLRRLPTQTHARLSVPRLIHH